jgi:hypothetical protein
VSERLTYLECRSDLAWLCETHLKDAGVYASDLCLATLGGNIDCPEWIEIDYRDDARRSVLYELQPDLTYRKEQRP